MLGLAAFNLKQMKEATAAFQAAVVLSPQSIYAHIQLGIVSRINGNYKESEEALLKAVVLSKELQIPEVHLQLALLYEKLERFNETIKELEKYLKSQPDSSNDKQIKDVIAKMKAKADEKK
jgi:tetratricopeptide (TPR) repeat protein